MSDLFPVTTSVASTAALLDLVQREYQVGTPIDGELWHAGITETHQVTTDRGRFLLRLYRFGWRTDDEVAYEVDALQHLARKGVSVALPILRADGHLFRRIQTPEGPRQVVLFTAALGAAALGKEGFSARYG